MNSNESIDVHKTDPDKLIERILEILENISCIKIYPEDKENIKKFYEELRKKNIEINLSKELKFLVLLYFYFETNCRFISPTVLNKIYIQLTGKGIKDIRMNLTPYREYLTDKSAKNNVEKMIEEYAKNLKENLEIWNEKEYNKKLSQKEIEEIVNEVKEKAIEYIKYKREKKTFPFFTGLFSALLRYVFEKRGIKMTLDSIAKIFGCSDNTISDFYNKQLKAFLNFNENKNLEIPENLENLFEICKNYVRLNDADKKEIFEIYNKSKKILRSLSNEEKFMVAVFLFLQKNNRVFCNKFIRDCGLDENKIRSSSITLAKNLKITIRYDADIEHWEEEFFKNIRYFLKIKNINNRKYIDVVRREWLKIREYSIELIANKNVSLIEVLVFLGGLLYYLFLKNKTIKRAFKNNKLLVQKFIEYCSGFSFKKINDSLKAYTNSKNIEKAMDKLFEEEIKKEKVFIMS